MRRFLRIIFGVSLLLLGAAGLVLPVLQGWLFLGMGALVLSRDVPVFGQFVNWTSERFPKTGSVIERILKRFPAMAD